MIIDCIENHARYENLSGHFKTAFKAIKEIDFTELEAKRHDIEGDELFYIVNRYTTKPLDECKLEAHRKYIDIQYMVTGSEIIGYHPLEESLELATDYDAEKDLVFYDLPEAASLTKLTPGMFAIFYPEDAHAPSAALNRQEEICKIVFKVKIDG